jgi:predicted transcriptional regulator
MQTIKRLPDSELEIMKIIWKANGSVCSAYIQEHLKMKKKWAACTILGFLTRLVDKGFITCEKHGKTNIYTAIVEEKEYLQFESKTFLEKVYGNSLESLVSALYHGKSIDKEDLKKLQEYIDEMVNEHDKGG